MIYGFAVANGNWIEFFRSTDSKDAPYYQIQSPVPIPELGVAKFPTVERFYEALFKLRKAIESPDAFQVRKTGRTLEIGTKDLLVKFTIGGEQP